jgi:hypothetical protein
LELWKVRLQHNPSFANWQPNAYESRGYQEGEFDEWWEAVTSRGYLSQALRQFAQAWVGAAYLKDTDFSITETLEDIRAFMSHMGNALWPSDWSTASLLQSLKPTLKH